MSPGARGSVQDRLRRLDDRVVPVWAAALRTALDPQRRTARLVDLDRRADRVLHARPRLAALLASVLAGLVLAVVLGVAMQWR